MRMLDVLYLLATIVFFTLMVGYTAACARLGRSAEAEREAPGDCR